MNEIPLIAAPDRTFNVVLGGNNCTIRLRQNGPALYLSLSVDNTPVVTSVICNNLSPLPPFTTTKFSGWLFFFDSQGDEHPSYEGLGTRWRLYYLEPAV